MAGLSLEKWMVDPNNDDFSNFEDYITRIISYADDESLSIESLAKYATELALLINANSKKIVACSLDAIKVWLKENDKDITFPVFKVIPSLLDCVGLEKYNAREPALSFLTESLMYMDCQQAKDVLVLARCHHGIRVNKEIEFCLRNAIKKLKCDEGDQQRVKELNKASSQADVIIKYCKEKIKSGIHQDKSDNQLPRSNVSMIQPTIKDKDTEKMFENALKVKSGSSNAPTNMKDLKMLLEGTKTPEKELQKMKQLLSGGAVSETNFKPLVSCIIKFLKQKDSISKEACITIAFLSRKCQRVSFEEFAIKMIQPLFEVVRSGTDDSSSSGYIALKFLIKNTQHEKIVPRVVYNTTSNSKRVKRKSVQLIKIMLDEWPKDILETRLSTFQEAVRSGMTECDAEARTIWREAFWSFKKAFHLQGVHIIMSMDHYEDTELKYKGDNDLGLEHYESLFQNVKKFREGRFSNILKAKIGSKAVALRLVSDVHSNRSQREIQSLSSLGSHKNIMPLLFNLNLTDKTILVTDFWDANLEQFIESKKSNLTDKMLNRMVQQLLDAVSTLHEINIVHCDLNPTHILIHQKGDTVNLQVSNFERSLVAPGFPIHDPSELWAAPETTRNRPTFSSSSDVYSTGLLCLYIWSLGDCEESILLHLKNENCDREIVGRLLKLKNKVLAKDVLEIMLQHNIAWREKAKDILLHPAFWKEGSCPFYMDRLYEQIKRKKNAGLDPYKSVEVIGQEIFTNWMELMPVELMHEMEEKVEKPYTNDKDSFIRYNRNLVIHNQHIKAAKELRDPLKMEKWLLELFPDAVCKLHRACAPNYDDQFRREFTGHLIS